MEAILSATALGGQIMLRPDDLGKVQPGYLADMILVDGNPLDEVAVALCRYCVLNCRFGEIRRQNVVRIFVCRYQNVHRNTAMISL